jgi:hypothetical protein
MSEERRRRQQERERQDQPAKGVVRKILVAVVIVAAFGGVYFLGLHKRTSRLDAFAQCLAAKQVKMYGLYWCTHCADQKEMFGSSFDYVPYIECGIKGQARGEQESCKQAGIKNFPTWEFPNGERKEGTLPLVVLSQKSGCSLP